MAPEKLVAPMRSDAVAASDILAAVASARFMGFACWIALGDPAPHVGKKHA